MAGDLEKKVIKKIELPKVEKKAEDKNATTPQNGSAGTNANKGNGNAGTTGNSSTGTGK
ncbi:hypothetical protein D3C76_1835800 [compost metagenome]